MDLQIQAQFDRLEEHLDTLINSVTSYNPTVTAAASLVEADHDLTRCLDELTRHQKNYRTLASLRATTTALDDRIRGILSLLAETRRELLTATPLTVPPKSSHEVEYQDLLDYAQRIAEFTTPPTHRSPLPPPMKLVNNVSVLQKSALAKPDLLSQPTSPATNGVPGSGQVTPPPQSHYLSAAASQQAIKTSTQLPADLKSWLDPTSNVLQFTPWPSEDVIRRGALSQIQALLDRGEDPAVADTGSLNVAWQGPDSRKHEDETTAKPETRLDEVRSRTGQHRSNMASRPPAQDSVFEGFELYNPDDE